ncbi:amidase [candidate division CSSED10-310 bacterium]|uniref:Amidase n=1 Tax=candidate division CSSED10-310 bacterium TaxID=2855610 RepID=A0ABV6Z5L1_UNCC1
MGYDLQSIKAPRMAGIGLRLFTNLVENDYANWVIMSKLLKDSGISSFRDLLIDEPPTLFPYSNPDQKTLPKKIQPVDLTSIPEKVPEGDESFRFATIDDFARAYREDGITPADVAQKVIQAIRQSNDRHPALRAIIAYKADDIEAQAQASSARFKAGKPLGIFDGVPVAIKDEVDQAHYPTTVGTKFLGKSAAVQDATTVARLRNAGALLIGKANMHEIGIGVTGFNPHHGTPRNPYNPGHYTGGSSSGPAAAVAAGLCPVALGADGGGSIRIPAAFCGLVGLKATFGRVSEHGAAPLCWSVAHIGPIAVSARDAALTYAVLAGPDPADRHTVAQPPVHLTKFEDQNLKGLKLGIYRPWFQHATSSVVQTCDTMVQHLAELGATIVDIEIPDLEASRVAHVITIVSEMAASMDRFHRKHLSDYGADVRINLALGRQLTNRDYIHAQRMRTRAMASCQAVLQKVDVVMTPATGCPAPAIPADAFPDGESNLAVLSEIMRYATLANLVGYPAISFPAGYDEHNLPIGIQALGRPWDEHLLLRLAGCAEQYVQRKKPQIFYSLLPK